MPSAATVDAWSALAPKLITDPYIAFELFNEPRGQGRTCASSWAAMARRRQRPTRTSATSPSATRPSSTTYAVWAPRTCSSPTLRGPGGGPRRRRASSIRSIGSRTASTPVLLRPRAVVVGRALRHPGGRVPLIATEWNYLAENCGTAYQVQAPGLLDYLRRHHIGVLGHVRHPTHDDRRLDLGAHGVRGTAVGGSGRVLRAWFQNLDELDVVRTPIPTGLRHEHRPPTGSRLAWDSDDDVSYEVLRDGAVIGRPTTPAWTDDTARQESNYVPNRPGHRRREAA